MWADGGLQGILHDASLSFLAGEGHFSSGFAGYALHGTGGRWAALDKARLECCGCIGGGLRRGIRDGCCCDAEW